MRSLCSLHEPYAPNCFHLTLDILVGDTSVIALWIAEGGRVDVYAASFEEMHPFDRRRLDADELTSDQAGALINSLQKVAHFTLQAAPARLRTWSSRFDEVPAACRVALVPAAVRLGILSNTQAVELHGRLRALAA